MKRNWYSKTLFSYFPIFMLTVSILIILSFLIVNELSRSGTKKADRISTSYVVSTLSRSLNEIEINVLQELEKNRYYADFVSGSNGSEDSGGLYDTVNELKSLIASNRWIDSIYLYRVSDDKILLGNGLTDMETFADRAFLEQALRTRNTLRWSPVRTYASMKSSKPVKVISIYKRLPIPFGAEGVAVINVNMNRIERMIDDMTDDNLSFLRVVDKSGALVHSSHPESERTDAKILNRITAERIEWTFESGIQAGQLFAWASLVSYVWIVIGILTVLFGIFYILYVTRRNYRPIQVMMNRIQALKLRGEESNPRISNELALIDTALENLIEQTMNYEKQHHKNLLIERRQLFLDLIEGEQMDNLAERMERLKPNSPDRRADGYAVIIAEIDDYARFQKLFAKQDQNVAKFAMMNLFEEMANGEHSQGWSEWISGSRIGVVIASKEALATEGLRKTAIDYRQWVSENFGVSMFIGIGPIVHALDKAGDSYRAADSALQHRLSAGQPIVVSDEIPDKRMIQSYKYLQSFSEFVREFRSTSDGWRRSLEELFAIFSEEPMADKDIRLLLHTLVQMLDREVGSQSDSLRKAFDVALSGEVWDAIEDASSLERIRNVLSEWLTKVYRIYVSVNETKNHRAMVTELKKYIEENFDNPDLSLKHLSDRFQISGKYVSYLFKDEFDLNFVDFLVKLRMRRAEELLTETKQNVQDIALQVGYANSITFGRVFKRVVGVTPGDYRKLNMKPKDKN